MNDAEREARVAAANDRNADLDGNATVQVIVAAADAAAPGGGVVSRQDFRDLFEVAEDMRAYVSDYFAEKWGHDEGLARAREALSPKPEGDEDGS